MLAILERGEDMRLIADALTGQSRRLASRTRSKSYAGPTPAIARAALRAQSGRLSWPIPELDPYERVLVRFVDEVP